MREPESQTYYEVAGNVHLHTRYSDGSGLHEDVARAAQQAGLNFIITTDHNVLARGEEGWRDGVLVLVGEEINDPLPPRANHLLALGIAEDVAAFAGKPQALVDEVRRQGGFGFIAHPCERASQFIGEPALGWSHWDVVGYAGIEIWNYMSEFKSCVPSLPAALWAVLFPRSVIRGPFPETLALYDRLLAGGKRVAITGGSDGHAARYSVGPIKKVVFPYVALFQAVNLHLLLRAALSGDLAQDRAAVYEAMGYGRGFVGYHALGDPRGFSFTATAAGGGVVHTLGDEVVAGAEHTFDVRVPLLARLRLLRDGVVVAEEEGTHLKYRSAAAGIYRVEAYRKAWLRWRGWVFSNPIYVRAEGKAQK